MANIRKRVGARGAKWQVQVRLAGEAPLTRTFDSHAAARAWARDMEGEAKRRRQRGGELLGEAIDRYVTSVLPTKAATTQRTDALLLRWWYEHHGTELLADLTPDRLARIRDKLAAGSSASTANRYLTALSAVLTRAYREWDWIRENPLQRVRRLPEPQGRVRFLNREEVGRLLVAAEREAPELRLLVAVAVYTGMRQGEALGLTWRDVDLQRRLIVLHRTKNRDRRGIPISDALLDELRRVPRRVGVEHLFPMAKDQARSSLWTWRAPWTRALVAAGIEDFRFHDLRHTAASHLAMSGATDREIAEVLGHKTLAMVKRYSHLSRQHVAGVLNRLGAEIGPAPRRRGGDGGDR